MKSLPTIRLSTSATELGMRKIMINPTVHILGADPKTVHRLNACAYQQSAITTFEGIQYAAMYTSNPSSPSRQITIARRSLQSPPSSWNYLTFHDYEQTTDDGHNTISIGICAGDGTIHISFDHHCDELKYRVSKHRLASDLSPEVWNVDSFSTVQNCLPGSSRPLKNVTYPRFIPAGDRLFFECRIGKAGAGSDALYYYDPPTAQFALVGTYLLGHRCNPYPNGVSYHPSNGTLHVTWTNRHFIEYDGANDDSSTAHKAQAGPNGPENNEGLYHAYTSDGGTTWNSSNDEVITELSINGKNRLDSQDPRLRVADIPRNSGIMNQEAQCVDTSGHVHVLNRENTSGKETWVHYYQSARDGHWHSFVLPQDYPTPTGPRGKIVYSARLAATLLVFPSNTGYGVAIALSRPPDGDGEDHEYQILWRGEEYTGEPLVDEEALWQHGILSIFILREQCAGEREVAVLDFII